MAARKSVSTAAVATLGARRQKRDARDVWRETTSSQTRGRRRPNTKRKVFKARRGKARRKVLVWWCSLARVGRGVKRRGGGAGGQKERNKLS